MSIRIFQYFNNLFDNLFDAFAGKATGQQRFLMYPYPATFPFSDKNKIR